jgi:hypothetical protein
MLARYSFRSSSNAVPRVDEEAAHLPVQIVRHGKPGELLGTLVELLPERLRDLWGGRHVSEV